MVNEVDRNPTVLNSLFFNAIKNLIIPEYSGTDPRADNIKYRKHPSIGSIKNVIIGEKFIFLKVSIENVIKEIRKLNTRSTDIP